MSLPGSSKGLMSDKLLAGMAIAVLCGLAIAFGSVGIRSIGIFGQATDSSNSSIAAGFAVSGAPGAATAQNQGTGIPPSAGVQSSTGAAAPGSGAGGFDSAMVAPASGNAAGAPAAGIFGTSSAASFPDAHPAAGSRKVAAADLNNLADSIKLDNGALENMDQSEWARELPIAEQMLQGICDCEQRNWLRRFVETANDALAGSNEYYKSVQILDSLPRNDAELTTRTVSN